MRLRQHNLTGILYMIVGILLLSIMDAVAKWMVKDTLDPIQLIAIRSWIIIIVLYIYFSTKNLKHELRSKRSIHLGLRGLFGFLAPYCYFKSLQTLPLADANVVFFCSTFINTALSWLLLKEKVGVHRWVAVIIGFIGVLIAIQPEGKGELVGYLYCLCSSLTYSMLLISGRWLARTEHVVTLVFYYNLMLGIISTMLLPFVWVNMDIDVVLMVVLFSGLALYGHLCLTTAFSKAPISVVVPFEYTAIIWAVLIGYFVWQDIPAANVIIGAIIIIGCGLYVIYRESRWAPE